MELLRELGYEFTDFQFYSAWLFLEESSAETIVNEVPIPNFVPELRGRLRTFSAGGTSKLEANVDDFQRLMVFVHLQPVYENRMWIRTDGDKAGKDAVEKLRSKFPKMESDFLDVFSKEDFEFFYPSQFDERVKNDLALQDKKARKSHKEKLLKEVLEWTRTKADEAIPAWKLSAAEPIELLKAIHKKLDIN